MTTAKRPLGITILAILIALFAILHTLEVLGRTNAPIGNVGAAVTTLEAQSGSALVVTISGIVSIILIPLYLLAAFKLWQVKRLGLDMTIFVSLISIITVVSWYFGQPASTRGSGIVVYKEALLPLIILFYLLFDVKVREAFGEL